jgi:hypothetical protein
MHTQERPDADYLSYMLRMWRKRDGNGKQVWCASLQEPGSRCTENFEDAKAMFAFLLSKLDTGQPDEHAQQEQQAEWRQQG